MWVSKYMLESAEIDNKNISFATNVIKVTYIAYCLGIAEVMLQKR